MLELLPLPAFTDNYIWMLHDGKRAVVVDPGDATPVHQALDERHLSLAGILVTHHHPDHTGGIDAQRSRLQGSIWSPARETTPEPRRTVSGGESFEILGLAVSVLDVPGHTAGHIAYVLTPAGEAPILFCGDTLFSAGCGRLFEGTPEQMHQSLSTLAALPGNTRVCCAHEYTLSNLRFARAVEPDNIQLARHDEQCQALRARGLPTLPSTIACERLINPFLRCSEPAVQASARLNGCADDQPVAVLATLREWKNRF